MSERICSRCHVVIDKDYEHKWCPKCGHVEGKPTVPAVWECPECGDPELDHGGSARPVCDDCGVPMVVVKATPSRVNGAGLGKDLDLGLDILMNAQEKNLMLDVRPIFAEHQKMLDLGSELLREAQKPSGS